MDQTRFDAIVRSWGTGSRRQALRLLVGAIGAVAGTTAASRSANASCSSNGNCPDGPCCPRPHSPAECCPPPATCCGGVCYESNICDCYCADEANSVLCPNDFSYCPDGQGFCCPPETSCCPGNGVHPGTCCPVGTNCCGGICCDPEDDEFCPFPEHRKCCPTDATVCVHDFSGVICFPTPPCNPGYYLDHSNCSCTICGTEQIVCGQSCCAGEQRCLDEQCQEPCGPDQTDCGPSCCAAGQRCVDGQCVNACSAGQEECGGGCRPRCTGGTQRRPATCQCTCPPNRPIICDKACHKKCKPNQKFVRKDCRCVNKPKRKPKPRKQGNRATTAAPSAFAAVGEQTPEAPTA